MLSHHLLYAFKFDINLLPFSELKSVLKILRLLWILDLFFEYSKETTAQSACLILFMCPYKIDGRR